MCVVCMGSYETNWLALWSRFVAPSNALRSGYYFLAYGMQSHIQLVYRYRSFLSKNSVVAIMHGLGNFS